jgi:hypothetical protein
MSWKCTFSDQQGWTKLCAWQSETRDSWTSSRHSCCCTGNVSSQLCASNGFIWFQSITFNTEQFATKHNIPMSFMKTHLLIGSPNGEMKSTYGCPQVNVKIWWIDFQADLVVLRSSRIDMILGMDWLGQCDGIILCAKKSVLITSLQRDRIEVIATAPSKEEGKVNQD